MPESGVPFEEPELSSARCGGRCGLLLFARAMLPGDLERPRGGFLSGFFGCRNGDELTSPFLIAGKCVVSCRRGFG